MKTDKRTKRVSQFGATAAILSFMLLGCYRSPPPQIPEFKPPPKPVEKEAPTPEAVEEAPAPVVEEAPPEAEPEPVEVAPAVPPSVAPPPEWPPEQEAVQGPTIIGTWRCVEMLYNGQSMPMPEGMEMTMTFAEDGTATISTSGGPMPEPYTKQGTYTLDGNQLTVSMEGEAKTGTCTFDGNDRVTLDFGENQIVLARA